MILQLSKKISVLLFILILLSCAAHQPQIEIPFMKTAGFWEGLWHGFIAPITFIISLFSDIRIYQYPNSGEWYDFGFLLGISVWGSGASKTISNSRKKCR